MKRQTLIALGVAIILGLIAVFLANTYLTGRERQLAASPEGMVRVAVAAMPLDYGADITPDKVHFVDYPTASLPPGFYKSMAELLPMGKRRVALRPIQVNQPLLAADLSGEGQNASIAALLPDGMRAATVRINDVSGVAGFVKPNDTVDVLITRQPIGPTARRGEQVTDVLLQNVRVIAMGQDAVGADGKPSSTRTATLEVTPLDAQKLALGQQLGQLSLVLRKPGEEQNIRWSRPSASMTCATAITARCRRRAPGGRQRRRSALLRRRRAAARIARVSRPRAPVVAPRRRRQQTSRSALPGDVETKDYEVGGYGR